MSQAIRILTPPAILPVTLSEAKIHERIAEEDTYNDLSIMGMLKTATILAENYTRRAFITQTWTYQNNVQGPQMEIPRPPLQSIVSGSMTFTTYNQVVTNIPQVQPDGGNTYFIDTIYQPGRLFFEPQYWSQLPFFFQWGYPWPWSWGSGGGYGGSGYGGFISPYNGILSFNFVSGYGDTADSVPQPIIAAILQIFGALYENRESQDIPWGAKQILDTFKVEYV